MSTRTVPCLAAALACLAPGAHSQKPGPATAVPDAAAFSPGLFPLHRDEATGRIRILVPVWDEDFLYVDSLPSGVGSNDIGLDRGRLGSTKVVRFIKVGRRAYLLQPNLTHRAETDNPAELRAVGEAFASSVLWGFDIQGEGPKGAILDVTDFCVRDAFDVAGALKRSEQGDYKLDETRSFPDWPGCKAFPRNTELQAVITFAGPGRGSHVRQVTPTATAITVRQRHSFVALPGPGFEPRTFDARSGFISATYNDYAAPISGGTVRQLAIRHRLRKKDPAAARSAPVQPIVYYVDSGAPEPVRSALVEGARWWNTAFEAAGFTDAFRVELLPPDADPMDVRYNVIQWVHRATRGWSYGNAVVDPRTGEILKGHVTLGSRRVRQDFAIAQALVGAGRAAECEAMALARLRQLSAHEVGHTLGLVHNYAASAAGRASVMDYPHPLIRLRGDEVDLSAAYGVGVGAWDVAAIRWGYTEFPAGQTAAGLAGVLDEARRAGLRFLSDADARPDGGMHPTAHLWDNGADPVAELDRLLAVRAHAIAGFGPGTLLPGQPLSYLDELLTPLYLLHRYQVTAVAKLVGGVEYAITTPGAADAAVRPVDQPRQRAALRAVLRTLQTQVLHLPDHVVQAIPPRTHGVRRARELLPSHLGAAFDPSAAAEAAARHSVQLLLHPHRAARLVEQSARHGILSLATVIDELLEATVEQPRRSGVHLGIQRVVDGVVIDELIALAADRDATRQARAVAHRALERLQSALPADPGGPAHTAGLRRDMQRYLAEPERYQRSRPAELPPGSPIGCGCRH